MINYRKSTFAYGKIETESALMSYIIFSFFLKFKVCLA